VIKIDLIICISNILKNAIKHSKNKWEINIKFENNTIEIKDNWIWIKEENLNKIFERNYSEQKWTWTWLWLSIIQKIINKNWRKIKVESIKWKETLFKIYF
jgi:signal transduction histidine kinase